MTSVPSSPSSLHIRQSSSSKSGHARTPSGNTLAVPNNGSGGAPVIVNFSGNWLLDEKKSDSIEPLLQYHQTSAVAVALSTASSSAPSTLIPSSVEPASITIPQLASVRESEELNAAHDVFATPTRSRAVSGATTATPALIIVHTPRRFTTYLHGLIPRYNASGELIRYDPMTNAKLVAHDDLLLNGEYTTVTKGGSLSAASSSTAPKQPAKREVRAYLAPHGSSVIIDTRCASKYDLERIERFLERDGKQLVEEIRILSCAPDVDGAKTEGVSSKFKQATTPRGGKPPIPPQPQVVVKEILFIRRVWKKIVDANPNKAPEEPVQQQTTSEDSKNDESTASTTFSTSFNTSASSSSNRLRIDPSIHSTPSSSPSPLPPAPSPHAAAAASAAIPPPTFTPSVTFNTASTFPDGAKACMPDGMIIESSSSSSSTSLTSRLISIFYPSQTILRQYDMARFLHSTSVSQDEINDPAIKKMLETEQTQYTNSRKMMGYIDLVLLLNVLFFVLDSYDLWDDTPENKENGSWLRNSSLGAFQVTRYLVMAAGAKAVVSLLGKKDPLTPDA